MALVFIAPQFFKNTSFFLEKPFSFGVAKFLLCLLNVSNNVVRFVADSPFLLRLGLWFHSLISVMILNGSDDTGPKSEAELCELGPSGNLAGCGVIMTQINSLVLSFYIVLCRDSYHRCLLRLAYIYTIKQRLVLCHTSAFVNTREDPSCSFTTY